MTERRSLFAYTELPRTDAFYVSFVSLNKEPNGDVTLTVRSRDNTGNAQGSITLAKSELYGLAMGLLVGAGE